LKVFRLWLGDDPSADVMYQDIVKRYVDSHLVEDALKNGVTELLLAPEGPKLYTREYAARYADVIKRLRDEKGVRITTTGVCNEPNNFDPKITPQQATAAVKLFREELEKRGLDDVKIVATENSFCNAEALANITAIKEDTVAWDDLAGIATHSYSMAANTAIDTLFAGSGKSYWITEAGDNGPEDLHDTKRALTMSGRFLNDMNHLVTHWVWFLGAEDSGPNDNSTRLIQYYPERGKNEQWFECLRKYYFLQQLSRTFDVGALFRYTECNRALPTKDLCWTSGQKPALNVAMAKNPDGSWAIGLVNCTDLGRPTDVAEASWKQGQVFYPPTSYEVTIHVKELETVHNLDFQVVRSDDTLTQAKQGTKHMKHGTLTLTLNPMEMVTLRSNQ
jgi:hypothetical protein